MTEIKQTAIFRKWIQGLKDQQTRTLIIARIDRLSMGLQGDVKPVGNGISEMRIHHGPGYRVYFQQRGNTLIVLLCGGNKKTQQKDIEAAKNIAAEWSVRDEK